MHLFTDVTCAGRGLTQRSTTGVHMPARGAVAQCPVTCVSNMQSAVGRSTPEVETSATNHGLKHELLPVMEVAHALLGTVSNAA